MSLKRGVCKICGCTDRNACYTDEHGACWWIDEQHTICSHCYYGWNKEKMRNKNADDEQIEIREAKYVDLSPELHKEVHAQTPLGQSITNYWRKYYQNKYMDEQIASGKSKEEALRSWIDLIGRNYL